MGAVNIRAIQKQHMKMDVQVQRAAKALDQGDGAGLCGGFCISGFSSQMRGNGPIDDTGSFVLSSARDENILAARMHPFSRNDSSNDTYTFRYKPSRSALNREWRQRAGMGP